MRYDIKRGDSPPPVSSRRIKCVDSIPQQLYRYPMRWVFEPCHIQNECQIFAGMIATNGRKMTSTSLPTETLVLRLLASDRYKKRTKTAFLKPAYLSKCLPVIRHNHVMPCRRRALYQTVPKLRQRAFICPYCLNRSSSTLSSTGNFAKGDAFHLDLL